MMRYELSDDEPELETLNISNDQYYLPLQERPKVVEAKKEPHATTLQIPRYGSKTIRHSLPAYDLWKAFFPTYLNEVKFRNFHRPKLRHYNNGPQAKNRRGLHKEHPIKNLSRNIFRKHMELKNKVIQAINSRTSRDDIVSKFLLIKSARELTAKDGELFLFEYCEEHPPMLSQVGMASNIRTYVYGPNPSNNRANSIKSQNNKATSQKQCDITVSSKPVYGYQEYIKTERQSKLIYYNTLKPGSASKFIENNLYRAPIFEHEFPICDFLVVRTRNSFYIRQVGTIFTVGQELPLTVVPSPNDIQRFRCDLSNLYIHKLFKASGTDPKSVNLDKLMKLFPDYHKTVLKHRMTHSGAKMVIMNQEQVMIQGTSKYGQLSPTELRSFLRPEAYCTNMSMLAARQRLRELNYTESMIFPGPGQTVELEPEVLAAPWNTTRAVVASMNNRSYLDLERHLIDPTGPAREGFSCVAWVKSPIEEEQAREIKNASNTPQPRRASNAPIPIDKNPLANEITREKLKRLAIHKTSAQLIAEVQADILSNNGNLTSSDDDSDADEDNENLMESDFNQQLDDLSRLVIGGKSVVELSFEKEEEERRKLLSDLRTNGFENREQVDTNQQPGKKSDDLNLGAFKNKILMITRTVEDEGSKMQRTEIVRDPRIMSLYVKLKGGAQKAPRELDGGDSEQLCPGDRDNISMTSNKNDSAGEQDRAPSRSSSLAPGELCRTDGTRITISKKVLEGVRPMRNVRRQSVID